MAERKEAEGDGKRPIVNRISNYGSDKPLSWGKFT